MTNKKEETKKENTKKEETKKEETKADSGFKVLAHRTMTCLDGSELLATQQCVIKTKDEYERLKADKRKIFSDIK